jgi:hypothetical protein
MLKADSGSPYGSFGVASLTPTRAVIFTANQYAPGFIVGRQLKGIYGDLPFDQITTRQYTADGDWAAGQLKGECADGQLVTGVSASKTSARAHSILCTAAGVPMNMYPPRGITLDISAGSSRSTGTSSVPWGTAIDWDGGFNKAQCASNEAITGVSQTTAGRIAKVRCTPMETPLSVAAGGCYPRIFSTADNRGNVDANEWATGFWRGECAAGEIPVGISANTGSGAAHAIYCCNVVRLP